MKNYIKQLVSILLIGIVVSACGKGQTPMPTQSLDCQLPKEWKIDFSLSGGFAGLSRSLSISSNGSAVAQDLRTGKRNVSVISQDDLNNIAGMLAEACPFERKQMDGGCADCFEYKLNIFMDSKQYELRASDVSIPERSAPLIEYLRSYASK